MYDEIGTRKCLVEHLAHHPINISHNFLPLPLLRPASFLVFNVSVSTFRTIQPYT